MSGQSAAVRVRSPGGTFVPDASGSLAGRVSPAELLTRYLDDGIDSIDLAKEYGVTPAAISWYLLRHAQEDWRTAQVARSVAAWEQSERGLRDAPDQLELSRAREQLRAAQWRLEKLCPKLFGQKVEVNQPPSDGEEDIPTLLRRIAFALKRSEAVTVDAEAVQDAEQA